MNIEYGSLLNAIQENIDESLISNYDFDSLLRNARVVWDNTAIEVTAKDFIMVFDIISYELVDYTGNDIIGD